MCLNGVKEKTLTWGNTMVEGNDGEQKFSVSLGPELEYPQSFCLLLLPVLSFFFFFLSRTLCKKAHAHSFTQPVWG